VVGLCEIDGQPTMYACLPALPTNGEGAPHGALVVLRRIDERLRERMERILGFDIAFEAVAAAEPGKTRNGGRNGGDVRVATVSETRMEVRTYLRTADDKPLLGLRLSIDRVVFQEGVKARRLMFWQLVVVAVVVAALTGGRCAGW
jgi:sensor domain CHASE-containing protein